jgi:hypothetical protein
MKKRQVFLSETEWTVLAQRFPEPVRIAVRGLLRQGFSLSEELSRPFLAGSGVWWPIRK